MFVCVINCLDIRNDGDNGRKSDTVSANNRLLSAYICSMLSAWAEAAQKMDNVWPLKWRSMRSNQRSIVHNGYANLIMQS